MQRKNNLKYNFVFLFAREDYWQAILGKEITNGEYSTLYKPKNKLMRKLFHYHWSYSLNRKIKVPFKSSWFDDMYNHKFVNDLPVCFVFMGGNNIRYDSGFCNYVKKRNPKNKIVIIHNDLISKHCVDYDYSVIRKKADLCTTYDKNEAENYGIEYFQETAYSKLIPDNLSNNYDYDIYFLGAAKDRLKKIHEAYRYLTSQGLNCKFIVTGVPKDKQIEGIEYSKGISYIKNLEYVTKSRCVLEIIQGCSVDITTRAIEAIAYKKKFITDCPMNLVPYFNERQLCQFKNVGNIDIDFINESYDFNEFEPKIDLDPMKRLYFIQEKLEKNEKE